MTLIKAQDVVSLVGKVRPITRHRRPAPSSGHDQVGLVEVAALRRELEVQARQLSERAEEVERLRRDVSRAYRDGEVEGRKTGLKEAEVELARQTEQLEAGVRAALETFSDELRSLERLAVLVALEGLGKILGDTTRYAGFLQDIIRRQVSAIEVAGSLRVEVCAGDFPSPEALRELQAGVGDGRVDVVASDALAAGDCRIKLRLGELDVGVGQQWSKLADTLRSLAEPEAAA